MAEWQSHRIRRGVHRSGFEKSVAESLKAMNVAYWFEFTDVPYLRDQMERVYWPDFVMYSKDHKLIFLEVKGWFKDDDVEKMTCVKRWNLDLDIRILSQNNSKAGFTGLKTSEWCEWKEFPCAVRSLPENWAREMMSPEEFAASGLPPPPRKIVSERMNTALAQSAMGRALRMAAEKQQGDMEQ